ncbi:MAG TPA: aldehyde dehydrogenase family protein [Gammaproteobacteria bacterium]|nr:aldehyde dehydrogenase family protein [Gammaproteobacteria bacterium]
MIKHRVLIAGHWQAPCNVLGFFNAVAPATGKVFESMFPISGHADIEAMLEAGTRVAPILAATHPENIAIFLDTYADGIEHAGIKLCTFAHEETGLPIEPRFNTVELPRTVDQMHQAARISRDMSWTNPVIDTRLNLRACFAPLNKPVVIFGPNNFPLAFNAVAGSDFVSAIVARNPVIAKAHPSHPQTSQLLAEIAHAALIKSDLPVETVQFVYHMPSELGLTLVSDRRVGAVGFTGSRNGGLAIKAAADKAGVPAYLEMASINPVFVLSGALLEYGATLAQDFFTSCMLGNGQFCTRPGLIVLPSGHDGEVFVTEIIKRFTSAPDCILLSRGVQDNLMQSLDTLLAAGAQLVVGGKRVDGEGFRFRPTLLRVPAATFIAHPNSLQSEAFGPVSLLVVAESVEQMATLAATLEGNLTGTIYSASDAYDDEGYALIAPILRARVGRLLNNKMPTGVAVSAAMNHGGPYPATVHPMFTSVGLPAAIHRFVALHSYDAVRPDRLPPELHNRNPNGSLQRLIDGIWTTADITSG